MRCFLFSCDDQVNLFIGLDIDVVGLTWIDGKINLKSKN